MKFFVVGILAVLVLAGFENNTIAPLPGEKHLANLQQLTSGGENAEAYFSFDQKKLIFQSTRSPYECDRIFTMNLDGTGLRMVSTGKGRTTCGYFLPGDTRILYASTHEGSPLCPARPDMSQGYVWALYKDYDIYTARADGLDVKPLTRTPGYDAEATVSPDGKRIVFTSVRDGDLELYSMNLDGSDVRRLTHEKGYDGGAFYSPDSKKIVYRAHNWILARRQFMQLRILQYEIALPHRALHFHDAVAHHAGQSRLRRGRIFNLPDRRIEHSAEKQRRIVAARAPLRTLYPSHVLHVLDAFPIPLIVERRKVMRRAVPLLIHIPMATLACLRLHEIFRRDIFSVARLHRAREEFPARSIALSIHRLCGKRRILHAIRVLPRNVARPPCAAAQYRHRNQHRRESQRRRARSLTQPLPRSQPRHCKKKYARHTKRNMRIQPILQPVRRPNLDQHDSQNRAERQ